MDTICPQFPGLERDHLGVPSGTIPKTSILGFTNLLPQVGHAHGPSDNPVR